MASWFTPSEYLEHVTPIPPSVPASKVVAHLHDHEFFIQSDPHMKHYELIPTPDPAPSVPEDREVIPIAPPVCYTVTDRVHTLPAGLWDSNVVSTYEFLNLERGVFVRIRSPMGMLMESVWEVSDEEDGGLVLVEDVVITCSRFLIGVIKNTCESGWEDIHAKHIAKLKES